MIVSFLTDGTPSVYYEFGTTRVPQVGEYVTAGGGAQDALPRGAYRVARVSFELQSVDTPPRATCVLESAS
jgi:hypothetical protein